MWPSLKSPVRDQAVSLWKLINEPVAAAGLATHCPAFFRRVERWMLINSIFTHEDTTPHKPSRQMPELPLPKQKPMTSTAFLRCTAFIASGLLAAVSAFAGQAQYSHGDPTPLEQQALELINRARSNPTQEGVILDSVNTAYSIDARNRKPAFFTNLRAQLAAYPTAAPLAFHPKLIASARAHSADMLARNYFAHVNPEGKDPTARGAAQGYADGVGENIDGGGATAAADMFHSHFGF